MNKLAFALTSLVALGSAAAAQVPAPDFVIEPVFLQMNSAQLAFQVQGPPNSWVTIFMSQVDPATVPFGSSQHAFARRQLDGTGHALVMHSIPSWQGPLPDVWFSAVLVAPSAPKVRAVVRAGVVQLAGAFAFAAMPDSACVVTYVTKSGALDIRVKTTPGASVSMWEVDCSLAPVIGAGFEVGQAGVNWIDTDFADAAGVFVWSGNVPNARCIVVMSNGKVIAVRRKL